MCWLRSEIPVSSVFSSTESSPASAVVAGSTESLPASAVVLASKLPPTVSGHVTRTSPVVVVHERLCATPIPLATNHVISADATIVSAGLNVLLLSTQTQTAEGLEIFPVRGRLILPRSFIAEYSTR